MRNIVYVAGAALAGMLVVTGVDARSSTPDEFSRLLASDLKRWAEVVQRLGLRAE